MRATSYARGMMAALALVIAAAAAGPLAAQDARVLGRVTDGVGNAVADARIVLVPDDSGAARQETVSGATGGFQFAGVAPGSYTLRAVRDGFPPHERRITVRPGQVLSQVVRLRTHRGSRAVENASRSNGR
jgi:protocatechuate 3,4-dioxygenase beta subunit